MIQSILLVYYFPGDNKVAQLLIEKGADVNIADARECTPLHTACWKGIYGIRKDNESFDLKGLLFCRLQRHR